VTIDKEDVRLVFSEELAISIDQVIDTLEYNTISEWDSIAHMRLIAALEDKFDIMIDTEDVVEMSTFAIACDTVQKYVNEN
jgi:acyl carrier protein